MRRDQVSSQPSAAQATRAFAAQRPRLSLDIENPLIAYSETLPPNVVRHRWLCCDLQRSWIDKIKDKIKLASVPIQNDITTVTRRLPRLGETLRFIISHPEIYGADIGVSLPLKGSDRVAIVRSRISESTHIPNSLTKRPASRSQLCQDSCDPCHTFH